MSAFHLKRIRLELDRTLRARPFVARAVRGDLGDAEYFDLVVQLGALVGAYADGAPELRELAALDASALMSWQDVAPPPSPRAVATLAAIVASEAARALGRPRTLDVCFAVAGTSWTRDAASRVARRWPSGVALLGEIARRGPIATSILQSELTGASPDHVHRIYALAEVTRGAVLGLVAHLEITWPAPVQVASLSLKE